MSRLSAVLVPWTRAGGRFWVYVGRWVKGRVEQRVGFR